MFVYVYLANRHRHLVASQTQRCHWILLQLHWTWVCNLYSSYLVDLNVILYTKKSNLSKVVIGYSYSVLLSYLLTVVFLLIFEVKCTHRYMVLLLLQIQRVFWALALLVRVQKVAMEEFMLDQSWKGRLCSVVMQKMLWGICFWCHYVIVQNWEHEVIVVCKKMLIPLCWGCVL